DDPLSGVVMWIMVIMGNLWQFFSWNAQHAGDIVKPGSDYHILCSVSCSGSRHVEATILFFHGDHFFKQVSIQVELLLYPPVIFECLGTLWLGVGGNKWHVADFETL